MNPHQVQFCQAIKPPPGQVYGFSRPGPRADKQRLREPGRLEARIHEFSRAASSEAETSFSFVAYES